MPNSFLPLIMQGASFAAIHQSAVQGICIIQWPLLAIAGDDKKRDEKIIVRWTNNDIINILLKGGKYEN